jgi:hypothetical protein
MGAMTATRQVRFNKYFFPVIAFILLLIAGFYIYSNFYLHQTLPPSATLISQASLEEKYGLKVNLLAVTAAGGMVDLRLKIVDGEKAKLLLQDKKNFPVLLAGDQKTRLNTDEDTKSQVIKFDPEIGIFLMYPNGGNVVKPGSAISILFGDIQLEPVMVR